MKWNTCNLLNRGCPLWLLLTAYVLLDCSNGMAAV